MDIRKQLIFLNGKDKTSDIYSYTFVGTKCNVVFNSSPKIYPYNRSGVKIFEPIGVLSPENYIAIAKGRRYSSFDCIVDFGPWYKIISGYRGELFIKGDVMLIENSLADKVCRSRFDYFKSIAEACSLKAEDGLNILASQYNKIKFLSRDTAAADFLSDVHSIEKYPLPELMIYPFGMNQSQKKAVENVFSSKISIIQGPPGTGKTQTILNIIANCILNNKTVAVVSSNNSATRNVLDKLRKNQLGFIAAFLGSRDNKAAFIENQCSIYPPLNKWRLAPGEYEMLKARVRSLSQELELRLSDKNRMAELEQELLELQAEAQHFEEYYSGCKKPNIEPELNLNSDKILRLASEIEALSESGRIPGLFFKLKVFFGYGSAAIKLLNEDIQTLLPFLHKLFYEKKTQELKSEHLRLEERLKNYAFNEKLQELQEKSMRIFKHGLFIRYGGKSLRPYFEEKDLRYHPEEFIKEYPVILSTTYSIKNSLGSRYSYDYLIVDEASQVDLSTGVLALSCAENAVIVGDLNQLPNVIGANDRAAAEGFWQSSFGEKYHFTTHSLLSSASEIWEDVPNVLLREHYRCHPKIINFCNQKFYGGLLIPMTEDKGETDVLTLYRCSEGSHARAHINHRQADIIENEVLPSLARSGYNDIGVIAPYNDQVRLLRSQLPSGLEIDTVHKFQGREKEAIILSSVDNVITDFVDDYHMLNVAVSRAVRSLTVVTSHNCGRGNTNYDDLVRYISYNNFQLVDSKTYSVFDLLYKEYRVQRGEFLRRHRRVSEYDSENLLYSVIEGVLALPCFGTIGSAVHVPLSMIIRDQGGLTEEERQFVEYPLSHTDFLLFNRMDKSPVLAIEVDGTAFHSSGVAQRIRDEKKDHIFALCGLSLLRLRTDESGEKEKIINGLIKAMR